MSDSFGDRMDAQRAVLKQINLVNWPREELYALSADAIGRWKLVNRLGEDNEFVKLAQAAGDALLFLANASQEQVSPSYASHSANISGILELLRSATSDARSVK